MIARLIVADLRTASSVWWGALVVVTAAAVAGVVPAVIIRAGLTTAGITSYALLAIAGTIAALTIVSVVIVVASVMRATVDSRRRTFALWLTVGVLPAQVRAIVLSQLTVVSVIGSVAGVVLGAFAVPPLVRAALVGSTGLGAPTLEVSPTDLVVVGLIVTVVVVLTSLSAARRAGVTPPLQLLHSIPPRPRARIRWVVALALLALAAQMAASLPSSVQGGGGAFLLLGAVMVATVSLGGHRLAAMSAGLWMRVVPRSAGVAFALARARTSRTWDDSAAIIPFFVAIALPSTFFASAEISASARGAMSADGSLSATGLILGGPVLLAAVGGTASIVRGVSAGRGDSLLLASIGTPPSTMRAVPLWVAVQAVGTAALLALAVEVFMQAVELGVLAASSLEARPSSDLRLLGVVVFSSLLLALLAVIVTWRTPEIAADDDRRRSVNPDARAA